MQKARMNNTSAFNWPHLSTNYLTLGQQLACIQIQHLITFIVYTIFKLDKSQQPT